jgi:hypothetical protein
LFTAFPELKIRKIIEFDLEKFPVSCTASPRGSPLNANPDVNAIKVEQNSLAWIGKVVENLRLPVYLIGKLFPSRSAMLARKVVKVVIDSHRKWRRS